MPTSAYPKTISRFSRSCNYPVSQSSFTAESRATDLSDSPHALTVISLSCKKSMFVDRSEHQASRTLVCPLPRCGYAWCKLCQAKIEIGGPRHSCDGSSELRHLMKEKGWKHCPGQLFRSTARLTHQSLPQVVIHQFKKNRGVTI